MRIWDVSPTILCRKHLLGEHRELHALWTIITEGKKGYVNDPETKRWLGKLHALYNRHDELVDEMSKRGYNHQSPLDAKLATGNPLQQIYIHNPREQKRILKGKNCECRV